MCLSHFRDSIYLFQTFVCMPWHCPVEFFPHLFGGPNHFALRLFFKASWLFTLSILHTVFSCFFPDRKIFCKGLSSSSHLQTWSQLFAILESLAIPVHIEDNWESSELGSREPPIQQKYGKYSVLGSPLVPPMKICCCECSVSPSQLNQMGNIGIQLLRLLKLYVLEMVAST